MNVLMNFVMFPLQVNLSDLQMKNTTMNSSGTQLFAIGIGIVVIFLIILNAFRNKLQSRGGGRHSTAIPRQFSSFTLHRLTNELGLDRDQLKMLDYVMKSGGVSDPERFLKNPGLMDRHFKRTYRLIEKTSSNDEELNSRLSILFATRNVLDSSGKGESATSSRQIPEKVPAVLTVDKVNYPVQVISSRGDTLVVENPRRSAGAQLHVAQGSKASLAFFTKSSKGFSVETRVLGTADTPHGPVLQLAHSGQIKKLSSRKFRRRETIISTAYYIVQVDSATRKMTVDKRRFAGNILDISVGGCSIKTNTPANPGQKLKIEFTHSDNSVVAALGDVIRTSRAGMSTVMHIKFVKVPRKSLNSINAMVYEYNEK